MGAPSALPGRRGRYGVQRAREEKVGPPGVDFSEWRPRASFFRRDPGAV
jgi:hypothetical protein